MASKKSAKSSVKPKAEGGKSQTANKNGKKSDSGSSSGTFFTWFIVLALLGVWTSIAVVYFDLVDYQGVIGKLVAYDTDGDGDFDVEDAKILLDEKPGGASRSAAKKDSRTTRDVGLKLREALKQQLAIIHERVEAKKLARLALAEVRKLLEKEEEEKQLDLGRIEIRAAVKERVAARLKEEEEKLAEEEMAKAMMKLKKENAEVNGPKEGAVEEKVVGKDETLDEVQERGRDLGKEKRLKTKTEGKRKSGD